MTIIQNNYRTCMTLVMLLAGLVTAGMATVAAATDVRLLWTNDTHGHLSPVYHREEGDAAFLESARREGRVGGFAHIATLVNRQRGELPERTLLLDSGDTWHGTVVPVRLGGTPVVEVMNAMGYDAMVPGNVEFFYDEPTLTRLFAAARFPIVAANFYDAAWGERVQLPNLHPYIVKQVGGLKIAIIGMTYHWMSKVADHPQWSFGLRIAEVQADVDRLRGDEKVDLVVVLSHMGWQADARYAELVNGIDIIVGAHTHDILYRPTLVHNAASGRDVIVVQSGSHGKMLGQLDLVVKNRRMIAFTQTLFSVRSRDINPDPRIEALIREFREPYRAELERVIGETGTLVYRQGTWQSPADNLVTDALRARSGQDVALAQPSRYGATILPGPITVEDVYNLLPTESPIYHMKFRGRQLRDMLEAAIENVVATDPLERVGGNMWRFSGMELSLDLSRARGQRIRRLSVGGGPLEDDRLYSLAEFNLYLRGNANAVDVTKTGRIGPHEVIAYVESQHKVAPVPDRRITDTKGRILSDHFHLHERWKRSGRTEIDTDTTDPIVYRGALDPKSGRLQLGGP